MAIDRGIKPLFYGMMLLETDSSGVKGIPPINSYLRGSPGGQLKLNNEGPIGGPKEGFKAGRVGSNWGPTGDQQGATKLDNKCWKIQRPFRTSVRNDIGNGKRDCPFSS